MTKQPLVTAIITLLSCIITVSGCGGDETKKDEATTKDASPTGSGNSDGTVMKFTARELIDEFKADDDAAIAKYAAKEIEVTGIVFYVGRSQGGNAMQSVIIMMPDVGKFAPERMIRVKTKTTEPWFEVGPQGKATIRARVTKVPFGPNLDNGVVVSFEGERIPRMKPAELAIAFKADRKALKAKYDIEDYPLPIILTGVVKAKSTDGNELLPSQLIHFEGADGVEVRFSTSRSSGVDLINAINVGETVTVRGEFNDYRSEDDFVHLSFEDRLD